MESGEAFQLILGAIESGHPANGYLLVGDLSASESLVDRLLRRLFPEAIAQIALRAHPDVAWLAPAGTKRIIKVADMRARIVEPMAATSFSGGWKVGVVLGADRMEPPSANAFLKSLEEPPPQTMFFLLTDAPDAILPTIISRTQRIDLPRSSGLLEGEEEAAVAQAFARRDATELARLFAELKESVDEGEAASVRKAFFRTLMGYVRQMMLSQRLPDYLAFHNIEAVEEAYAQNCNSLNDEMVLSYLMDRLRFPK